VTGRATPYRVRLRCIPVTHGQANAFVAHFHRHTGALPSSRIAVAAIDEQGRVVGVAIAGWPKARGHGTDGLTLEVSRVCTDGTYNACSFLYGHITRAAKALGYRRLVTYTLASEPGTSLKASGWRLIAETKPESWARRETTMRGTSRWSSSAADHISGAQAKNRWQIDLHPAAPGLVWPMQVADDDQLTLELAAQ
jgi:hypothetical protein